MNKLLRSPIAAKHRASQAGVLPPGARQFALQTRQATRKRVALDPNLATLLHE